MIETMRAITEIAERQTACRLALKDMRTAGHGQSREAAAVERHIAALQRKRLDLAIQLAEQCS